MRRIRRDATKVWHNPELHTAYGRGQPNSAGLPRPTQSGEDRRAAKQHRAALEALFSPRKEPEAEDGKGGRAKSGRDAASKAPGRIVLAPPPQSDPKAVERQRLLSKLLCASGRPNISKAANEFLRAGHTFPAEQDVYLQLLEHSDEQRIQEAIDELSGILVAELPKRRAVLESRLRRIEEFAEEPATREAAERLRRQVSGRPEAPGAPSAEPGSHARPSSREAALPGAAADGAAQRGDGGLSEASVEAE
ncbi:MULTISPECIES: hypothetical protein [Sorangium]|uniref:Uncharacterized protein n=1 Tax=Sorangium cellulosum TaxID=56 RepID=A0A4V0NH81_SORCE|nr:MULTISPECIES: hypothetical protein [Sorangium]AUX35752.1 hypothetical protein SOCE836_079500 [Sorangium cellulosum]WCQ95051.1 hypothetical protein NQZ70_07826 [Sorangium sp. Soce836]